MNGYDFAVIGGGIIGLATANAVLQSFPRKRVLLLEKEQEICAHQCGRNSGVIHSGIYYKPGNLKAQLCRLGNASMVEFCRAHNVLHSVCRKLIVAEKQIELSQLGNRFQRGKGKHIKVEKVEREQIREIERMHVCNALSPPPRQPSRLAGILLKQSQKSYN